MPSFAKFCVALLARYPLLTVQLFNASLLLLYCSEHLSLIGIWAIIQAAMIKGAKIAKIW